jgi:hypothetical protein
MECAVQACQGSAWQSALVCLTCFGDDVCSDICRKNKKVFAHEHQLFSPAMLSEHNAGRDKISLINGFKGHPECGFCRKKFYDDEQLFEHCRDQHEQCHICMRADPQLRNVYYRDYNELQEHFSSKHYSCDNPECLEKKFVVFATDIDLKAHQSEVHMAKSGGQRSQKARMRQVEVNFSIGSQDERHRRAPQQQRQERRPRAPVAYVSATVPTPTRSSSAPRSQEPVPPPPPPAEQLGGRFPTRPQNFGEQEDVQASPPIEPPSVDPAVQQFVETVMARIRLAVGSDTVKQQQVQFLLREYAEHRMEANELVQSLCLIRWVGLPVRANGNASINGDSGEVSGERKRIVGSVIQQIVLELRDPSRGGDVLRSWKDRLALSSQMADLQPSDILTSSSLRGGSAWDATRVPQKASLDSFPSLSTTTIGTPMPSTSTARAASNPNRKTPWAGKTTTQRQDAFPLLPMRTQSPLQRPGSAKHSKSSVWSDAQRTASTVRSTETPLDEPEPLFREKKKGKQVVLRWG